MPTKLRWGLLGTARINRSMIPALRLSDRNEVVGIASRSLDRAREYARQWDIPRAYGSYEELLGDTDIDVIYNPLPNHLHAEFSIKAAHVGKHVLCEKPLALSLGEVDAIADAAHQAGVLITEALMYRHNMKTHQILKLVNSGDLGEVRQIRSTFTFRLNRLNDFRWIPSFGGGSLWDIGCYLVDFARIIMGQMPKEVLGYQITSPSGIDVNFVGLMRFYNDTLSQLDTSFRLPHRRYMEIRGSKSMLIVPEPFTSKKKTRITLKCGNKLKRIYFPAQNRYLGQIEDLADCILEGKKPLISLEESRQNVIILSALLKSAHQLRPIQIPPTVDI